MKNHTTGILALLVLASIVGCGGSEDGGGGDGLGGPGEGAPAGESLPSAATSASENEIEAEAAGPLPDEAPVGASAPVADAANEMPAAPEEEAETAEVNTLLNSCFTWDGQSDINKALANHDCVSVAPGSYGVTKPIRVPAGKTLIGQSNNRTAATFFAAPGFSGSQLLTDDLSEGATATVRRLTFDSKVRTNGIGTRHMTVNNVEVKNGRCWGVAVAGRGFRLEKSNIHHHGSDPNCNAAPGGGIYVTHTSVGPDRFAPIISGNSIHDNVGPGLDIAGVWDGKLIGNDIRNNSYWAAVSVFGSGWEIYDNRIYHPTRNRAGIPDGQPYWKECRGGPNGTHTAAVMVCERTDENGMRSNGNFIHDNSMAAYYGVQLIGNDETRAYMVPRSNRVMNNNLTGSVNACVDDFRPGQWSTGKNTWTGCTPIYF